MNDQTFRYESWAVTDKGRVRELNEDNYLAEPQLGLWVVADGMGGYDAGEVASAEIIQQMKTLGVSSSAPDQHARFVDRLTRANAALREYSAGRGGAIVGATCAALLLYGTQYRCMWMGDSRVYQFRRGQLVQISHDHSEVQELIDRGVLSKEEARTWPRKNVITRAVGVGDEIDIDVRYGEIESGDTYLLCSDGLIAHVTDDEIEQAATGRKAREICEALLELTLSRGASDNVTIIVVQCRSADSTIPVDSELLAPA
jgi:protein phosphatase